MTGRLVPAGNYARLMSRRGPVQTVVIEAWQSVWNDAELKAHRSYAGDLELYGPDAQDPEDAIVELQIGLK